MIIRMIFSWITHLRKNPGSWEIGVFKLGLKVLIFSITTALYGRAARHLGFPFNLHKSSFRPTMWLFCIAPSRRRDGRFPYELERGPPGTRATQQANGRHVSTVHITATPPTPEPTHQRGCRKKARAATWTKPRPFEAWFSYQKILTQIIASNLAAYV